jgi:hypothetical protein
MLRPGKNASVLTLLLCFTSLRCFRPANRSLKLGGRKIQLGRIGCDAPSAREDAALHGVPLHAMVTYDLGAHRQLQAGLSAPQAARAQ